MKQITSAKEFTQYCHALTAFQQAQRIAALMAHLNLSEQDKDAATLFGALCGYYARPFGRNDGIGRLMPEDIIPKSHLELHERLRTMRNKIFLHTDAKVEMSDGNKVNELKFTMSENGESITIESQSITSSLAKFDQIKELIKILIATTDCQIQQYLKEQTPGPLQAGCTYSLSITNDDIHVSLKPFS